MNIFSVIIMILFLLLCLALYRKLKNLDNKISEIVKLLAILQRNVLTMKELLEKLKSVDISQINIKKNLPNGDKMKTDTAKSVAIPQPTNSKNVDEFVPFVSFNNDKDLKKANKADTNVNSNNAVHKANIAVSTDSSNVEEFTSYDFFNNNETEVNK